MTPRQIADALRKQQHKTMDVAEQLSQQTGDSLKMNLVASNAVLIQSLAQAFAEIADADEAKEKQKQKTGSDDPMSFMYWYYG